MKTIILKGQEIKIGSKVRFVNDKDLYSITPSVIKPKLGQVYTVRGFSDKGGFLLEEIKNVIHIWTNESGEADGASEPGFAAHRFEPTEPLRKKKIVQIKIHALVEERLDIQKLKKISTKKEELELELN
jgi:hypothetical protein